MTTSIQVKTLSQVNLRTIQQGFKYLNRFMVLLWRLGAGGWLNVAPGIMGRYMVIVLTGRKSGLKRFAPVNYAEIDGDVYCVAGFGANTHWYQNLKAIPEVELWLPTGRWHVRAEDATAEADALGKIRQVLLASGFVSPLIGITPRTMSDADLAAATEEYRLLRFCRLAPATGAGGPGDLAWVWFFVWSVLILALKLWQWSHRGHERRVRRHVRFSRP